MTSSGARYDVFLCYNNREKESALRLETTFEKEGLRVFLDDRALRLGSSLPSEISTAIGESSSFIVLIGPSGIGNWQSFEVDVAVQRKIEDTSFIIIVALLPGAGAREVPSSLRHLLHIHFANGLDDSATYETLTRGIRGELGSAPSSADVSHYPRYRSMAPHPASFVQRPEFQAVLNMLTRENEGEQTSIAVGLTTALRGAGGFGKTALAQAICEHEAVRTRFPAGILWITLGQNLSEAQRLDRVLDLLRWWTRKEPSSYETLEAAASVLRDSLSGQPVLLVLDDVWFSADVAPFEGIADPAMMLITTRNTRALPPTALSLMVDALELPRAIELLGQGLRSLPATSTLERLAARLGEWPILLKLVNAQLLEEYRSGFTAQEAFETVEYTLDEIGLTAFDRTDEEARNLAVRRTVEASLQRLSPEEKELYARLAVFSEDEHIPLAVLGLLWDRSTLDVTRVCRRLAEMSLLYSFDPVSQWIQLHDVMRAYLLREHKGTIQSFHGDIVDKYHRSKGQLDRANRTEAYFIARLPYHLKESGRGSDLEQLLFSYSWLENKLRRHDVNAAMADYELLPGFTEAATVRQVLLLSRSILTEDRSQLASQLHGRLAGYPSDRITTFLEAATASQSGPWLDLYLRVFGNQATP
jgi:hypothetical protein